jgi:hypothetical protein
MMSLSPTHAGVRIAPDRRAAVRAPLSGTVTLTVRGRLVDAVAADVSATGIRLVARLEPQVGDEVSIVFFLGGELVASVGTVCWTKRTKLGLHAFGVHFRSIEEDGAVALSDYCRRGVS